MTEAAKPKTRQQLEEKILELEIRVADLTASDTDRLAVNNRLRCELDQAKKTALETRAMFADLKERLVKAEAETQRMRGYIARVQEDDVVREELVTVGDPSGEQRMVPKRKPTPFEPPSPYSIIEAAGESLRTNAYGERKPPRHWVTY